VSAKLSRTPEPPVPPYVTAESEEARTVARLFGSARYWDRQESRSVQSSQGPREGRLLLRQDAPYAAIQIRPAGP
jgi:hypothetical protein